MLDQVARNWLERLSPKRLFRSTEMELTLFSMEYMEFTKAMEYWERRFWLIRVPFRATLEPSMVELKSPEEPLVGVHFLLEV